MLIAHYFESAFKDPRPPFLPVSAPPLLSFDVFVALRAFSISLLVTRCEVLGTIVLRFCKETLFVYIDFHIQSSSLQMQLSVAKAGFEITFSISR